MLEHLKIISYSKHFGRQIYVRFYTGRNEWSKFLRNGSLNRINAKDVEDANKLALEYNEKCSEYYKITSFGFCDENGRRVYHVNEFDDFGKEYQLWFDVREVVLPNHYNLVIQYTLSTLNIGWHDEVTGYHNTRRKEQILKNNKDSSSISEDDINEARGFVDSFGDNPSNCEYCEFIRCFYLVTETGRGRVVGKTDALYSERFYCLDRCYGLEKPKCHYYPDYDWPSRRCGMFVPYCGQNWNQMMYDRYKKPYYHN